MNEQDDWLGSAPVGEEQDTASVTPEMSSEEAVPAMLLQLDGDEEATAFDADEPYEQRNMDEETFGTFFVGSLEFALPTSWIREVVPFPAVITTVPLSDSAVLGLFSLRGELIPIVDLALLLGMEPSEDQKSSRVAVVEQGGTCIGLALDRTGEVLRPDANTVHSVEHSEVQGRSVINGAIQRLDEGRFIQILSPELIGLASGSPLTGGGGTGGGRACTAPQRTYSKAVVVRIGSLEFAFRIEDILEIHGDLTIKPSPPYFEHCAGVASLRGQSVVVLDLRSALGADAQVAASHYVLVPHGSLRIGLAVDALVETYEYPDDTLQDLPELLNAHVSSICSQVIASDSERSLLMIHVQNLCEFFQVDSAQVLSSGAGTASEPGAVLDEEEEDDLAFFAFRVGELVLCVLLEQVLEVQELSAGVVTIESSDGPGLLNLRGTVVPLVQAHSALGVDSAAAESSDVALILESRQGRFGLVIDGVVDIKRVRSSAIADLDQSICAGSLGNASQHLASTLLAKSPDGSSEMLFVLAVDSLIALPDARPAGIEA